MTPACALPKIPIARPCFADDAPRALAEALKSGWVSQGPLVQAFEDAIAARAGAAYAVATTSWTTAFHLALLLHGIGPGDDVLCPSYSFIATANVIRHVGATPRFVDIDPQTLNLDAATAEAVILAHYRPGADGRWRHGESGGQLRAILGVHQIGMPFDIDALAALAERYGLDLLEDSACALGSEYKGRPVGASGFCGAFSFHPRKIITTGEGGMLLLADDKQAERARRLRLHGMSLSDLARHGAGSTVYETYPEVGYNYKLTDLQAALGLSQLAQLDDFLAQRQAIARRYDADLGALPGVSALTPPPYVSCWNAQSYPVRLLGADERQRDAAMRALDEAGVATRRGIPPIHLQAAYDEGAISLPMSEAVSRESFFLPIYPGLSANELDRIVEAAVRAIRAVS
ncbi:MAG: DegT/DnrJ/EryC1/StrS family aminotransferase [Vampirovibrionales bacterium]|nr:DegT/DnrJ/EryC1/StrS family aminotransferase [Vampirovibrionales bacterium]